MEWVVIVTALINGVYVSQPIWHFYKTREDCRYALEDSLLPLMRPTAKFECKKGYPI